MARRLGNAVHVDGVVVQQLHVYLKPGQMKLLGLELEAQEVG